MILALFFVATLQGAEKQALNISVIAVSSTTQANEGKEKLYRAIQKSLKYHRAAQWVSVPALLMCAFETTAGSTALVADRYDFIPQHNNPVIFTAATLTGLVSGILACAPLGTPTCMDLDCFHKTSERAADEAPITEAKGVSIVYSASATLSLVIFTASLATMVSWGSLEGSAGIFLVGGVYGAANATRLLIKSCWRSRKLRQRVQELAEEEERDI